MCNRLGEQAGRPLLFTEHSHLLNRTVKKSEFPNKFRFDFRTFWLHHTICNFAHSPACALWNALDEQCVHWILCCSLNGDRTLVLDEVHIILTVAHGCITYIVVFFNTIVESTLWILHCRFNESDCFAVRCRPVWDVPVSNLSNGQLRSLFLDSHRLTIGHRWCVRESGAKVPNPYFRCARSLPRVVYPRVVCPS